MRRCIEEEVDGLEGETLCLVEHQDEVIHNPSKLLVEDDVRGGGTAHVSTLVVEIE